MKKRLLFIITFVFNLSIIKSQDTLKKLDIYVFMQYVKMNHPLAKQANLLSENADANLLLAKGNFDPKFFYDIGNKYYDSKNYYELQNGGLKIPTWFGIELKGGYENNSGIFMNPENTVPPTGVAYTQISFSLLQGLVIDERRATLKQAEIFSTLSDFEKINMLNELLYKAGKAYWDWQLSYSNLKVYEDAVTLSKLRFEATVKTAKLGDRPFIDTVESNIQFQDRTLNYQQALLDYKTKTLLLSNFLWLENNIPAEISEKTIPDLNNAFLSNIDDYIIKSSLKIDSTISQHPNLKVYEFKLQQLNIEKKLKKEKLKPTLNLNYNPLFKPDNIYFNYQNNYKLGATFNFPIFLRKERGDLRLTKIKIENTTFEFLNKQNELKNKVKANLNEMNNFKIQIDIFNKNVANYEQLWLSEKKLFESGESSLFMINTRETSYINAKLKLNELRNKYYKSLLESQYTFGQLATIY